MRFVFAHFADIRALRAFHQHLDGAVGQLEHLQDVGDAAHLIEVIGGRLILGRRFWATSMMLLPASIAVSSALMDFGRPTNSGITMCGNTTTSRSGNSGKRIGSAGRSCVPDIIFPSQSFRRKLGLMNRLQDILCTRFDASCKMLLPALARPVQTAYPRFLPFVLRK
ncbi:hypothetical protein OR16_26823 [Cupriavidus basilensis OR16]|uniref:Uncharacterized protein n=1 Tax=Cupriavidus basilensis OR16 TaxID=1127483 RepID=H1SB32_9BURK|nr:hypothetical protein OR16_26823 [Cupriavidus basilensis OR16]